MQSFSSDFTGTDGGPPSTEAYKRAVYKQAPRHFAVEVLSPQKHGHAYSYGMLISPLEDSHDRHSIISRTSDNSNGSSGSSYDSRTNSTVFSTLDTSTTAPLTTDYEVWRRWEDCLYFQDLLEVEYGRMSREKRARLQAGKGVKKNGMYAHEDPIRRLHRAASFESLPPGPDPSMIAKDVHEVLPRLTKKGTLFKASKETIEQRGREFKALIEALLCEGDDVPMLIQELRQLRAVRDFFGFWRRDQDRLEKQFPKTQDGGDKSTLRGRSGSLGSRASSVFSSSGGVGMYFSASTLSLQFPAPTIAPEPSPTHKGPRRPAFMQNGKGAMIPASPSSNEPGPSKESATPRRRAQTLQSTSGVGYASRSGMGSSSGTGSHAYLGRPPASAPAGMSFATAIEGYYSSESASACGSPTSPQANWSQSSASSPRFMWSTRSSQPHSESRYSNSSLSGSVNLEGKSFSEAGSYGPIIVSLEEGETLPFDEDDHSFDPREHGYFVPYDSSETRLGGLHRLQDLTIKEEDEREIDDEQDSSQYDHSHSDYQTSGSSTGHGSGKSVESEEEHRSPASPRSRRTIGQSFNRLGMFFRPPSSADSDTTSIIDSQTVNDTERPKSPTLSTRSQTPISSARIAAAHADALRALTGGRALSPTSSGTYLAPPDASARSSVLTTTSGSGSGSMSSGSTNSEHARSSDTQSSIDARPYSYQSSIDSCVDIDRNLTSSPVVLHSPLLEEFDDDGSYLSDQTQNTAASQRRQHDSISSVQTFMTESSMDMVIPPREQRPTSPWSAPASSDKVCQTPTLASRDMENGELPLDSFFYASGYEEGTTIGPHSPSREYVHGSLSRSDSSSKPFLNRPSGQFDTPWVQQGPISPSFPASARNSVMTMDSSISMATFDSRSISSGSLPPTANSYAPSIASTLSEEASANTVSIKVICGDHIVAFRIDRNSSLTDVREKLWHKLVDQQGLTLAYHFALAYKPPGPGRVQELRKAAGRVRSSSVSSVGKTDPNSLRILFSQRDWLDAVGSSVPGSKVTLHVLNR